MEMFLKERYGKYPDSPAMPLAASTSQCHPEEGGIPFAGPYVFLLHRCSRRNNDGIIRVSSSPPADHSWSDATMLTSSSSFMNAKASCGTGFCHTGANDCRCNAVGPSSRSTARCLGVL